MHFISSKNLALRQINSNDLNCLFRWRNCADYLMHCTSRRQLTSVAELDKELIDQFSEDKFSQVVIKQINRSKVLIGSIWFYDYNPDSRNGFISLYIDKKFRKGRLSVEALALYMVNLFEQLNLNKIYFEVYSNNLNSLKPLTSSPCKKEARLVAHRLQGRKWLDFYLFAFYKNDIKWLYRFLK